MQRAQPAGPADLDTPAQLRKRARRKYATRGLAAALAQYAKETDHPLERSFRRSFYCAEVLHQHNGTLTAFRPKTPEDERAGRYTGGYCGNRWCLVCSAIRTARAWAGYMPVFQERAWRKMQFVTLTRANVSAVELAGELSLMLADFTRAKESMNKTDRVPLVALRKLEVTYNAERDDYHPHFHLIVQSRQMARLLVARWLDLCGDRATAKAQDVRDANAGSVAELFKYFTKLVVKSKWTPTPALATIFAAMRGRRVYQPVGFTRAVDDDETGDIDALAGTLAPTRILENITWAWRPGASDWTDDGTGECLTGYEPGERFRAFVDAVTPA